MIFEGVMFGRFFGVMHFSFDSIGKGLWGIGGAIHGHVFMCRELAVMIDIGLSGFKKRGDAPIQFRMFERLRRKIA